MKTKTVEILNDVDVVSRLTVGKSFPQLMETFAQYASDTPVGIEAFTRFYSGVHHLNSMPYYDRTREAEIRSLITPLLKLYRREDIQIAFIDSDEISVYNMGTVAIAFSRGFLNQLDEGENGNLELMGIVAHELSHQIFQKLYEKGNEERCHHSLHQVEYLCDALATKALQHLGINDCGLVNFLDKNNWLISFTHPNSANRIKLIKRLQQED